MPSDALDQSQIEREQLVAEWLIATPGFFERHAEILPKLELADSHDGKVVSLQEKQMAILRSQNRDLNRRLSDMLRFGAENDRTQVLMVEWLERLLATNDRAVTLEQITNGLNSLFEVGRVEYLSMEQLETEDREKLQQGIFSGPSLLDEPFLKPIRKNQMGSFAALMLMHEGQSFGALCFFSDDPEKFQPEMGLVYLEQLGKLAAAALSRFQSGE